MVRERSLRRSIITALEKAGCVVIPQPGVPMGRAGRPDLLVCVPPGGRFAAVEVKTDRGRLTALQVRWLERIRTAGGLAVIARSVEDALTILEGYNESASGVCEAGTAEAGAGSGAEGSPGSDGEAGSRAD